MGYTPIFFDLETTGLGTCDIIQIGAVCGMRTFNAYIVPHRTITTRAFKLTGFSVKNVILYCYGVAMETIPLEEALTSFIDFLDSFWGPVYLATHNAQRFDAPILERVLWESSLLWEFQRVMPNYLDTLVLSRRMFNNLHSYSLPYLVDRFLMRKYGAHSALEEARILQALFYVWNPGRKAVLKSLF
ncbi:uncharacterized protein LOC133477941 isoform X2 [Phyllopteryx taeniolatus]|uniref:uncharacterized protein LOC133477941 isoform X2 n=1 Tax=Phyllopteryx taeniolatus TaxID=161469 RepID=UPI002AD41766|nr:uncharacterized protein LOC133477941 isoform X2 [Phyllopteryx taeniolatus]